jgi:amino acid adenylation domain-containing protein
LPMPDDEAYAHHAYEAPEGEREQTLAAIWQELLHVERVGRHDNFFELGGHSLLAVQLVSRIRQALRIEVALGTIFEQPVLKALAAQLPLAETTMLTTIARADRSQPMPLSLAQQRLWFLTQLEGASEAYHMSGAVRLEGVLNRDVLQRALQRIVARHETLRTCFVRHDGMPVQGVQKEATLAFDYQDLRGQHEQAVRVLSEAHAAKAFDLTQDLPVRAVLLQLADDVHVMQVVMHHIASDGWSVGIFLQELSQLYAAFQRDEVDPLPPLDVQYADYATWQRQWLEAGQLQAQTSFWQRNLAGAPTVLDLPSDRPRPMQQDFAGASIPVQLDRSLSESLKALSQRHGTTLYMTLLASWAALLGRLSRQDEVVVGASVAGRNRAEIEGLIGFFVNTIAMRIDLSDAPGVAELLLRTKAHVLAAQTHQDLPFDQVVEAVKPPRSTAHPPLFQVMFDWHNAPAGDLVMPGLVLTPLETAWNTAQFELTLSLQDTPNGIAGHLNYATALFDQVTVERYLSYWVRLLQAMTEQPDTAVARMPILGEVERQRLLLEWNDTARDYPLDTCVHSLFEAQAARTPDAIAVACGDEQISYAALNHRANQLAHHLRKLGVQPDSRVALCMERGVATVLGLLAILKAGGAYVPLDAAYPGERIAYMLQDSHPVVVLASKATQVSLRTLLHDDVPVLVLDDVREQPWTTLPAHNINPDSIGLNAAHLAYVIYTSGSTGQPKGVMIEHRNLVNYTLDAIRWFGLQQGERVLQQNSLNFDLSLEEMMPALLSGATLIPSVEIFGSGGSGQGHPAAPSMVHLTAAHWQQLVGEWHQRGVFPAPALDDVRLINVTGDAISPHKLQQWEAIRPPHTQLINTYGPTEITISCSAAYVTHEPSASRVSIGRPFANSRMYLLDEGGSPVPVGIKGELYIGGAGVARGYLNRAALTAERFVGDPFLPGERLYKTGDLACWRNDGQIEFVGRNDFQVKVRGFRVEPGEIELKLAAIEGVQDVVVIAGEDPAGEKRLIAYYTGTATVQALRKQAQQRLPAYMAPAAYVHLTAFPLTPNGKLDRKALPAPDDAASARRDYEAPQGDVEQALAEIWASLLRQERVGRHDNFFDLGGHSLLTVSLIERMRKADLQVDVADLFTAPTLAELALRTTKSTEILL